MEEGTQSRRDASDRPRAGELVAPIWAVLALIAIAALFLREGLSGSKILLPFDCLAQFEPWKSAGPPVAPQNPLLLDQVIVLAPWLQFAAQRLHAGELPLWNPANYGGQPIAGAWQMGLWWPPNWAYFADPSWSYFGRAAWLKLALSGFFMLLFLRRLGLAVGPAAVGALAFMLCGFQVVWLGHNQSSVALFLPLLFWLVERMAAQPSARNAALAALAIALQFAAGHAQTSAHVLIAAASWALFRTRSDLGGARLSRAGLGRLALAGALGAALAAPQILPFAEYLRDSQGLVANARADLVEREGAWKGAAMLLDPRAFGSPLAHDYRGPSGAHLNYSELVGGYVGRAVLALALAYAAWLGRGRLRWFLIGFALVGFCAAYQLPPVYDALRAVPLLSATKLMRLSLWLAFSLAALGALGLQALLDRFRASPRAAALVSLGAFALVGGELFAFGYGYNPAVDPALAAPRTPVTDFLTEKVRTEPPFRVLAVDGTALIANANLYYGIPLLTGYDSLELREMHELVAELSSDPRREAFTQEIRSFDKDLPLGSLLGVRYLLSTGTLPAPFRLVFDGPCKVFENPAALPRVFFAARTEIVADPAERLKRLASPAFDPYTALVERGPPEALPVYVPMFQDVLMDSNRLVLKATNTRSLAFEAVAKERSLLVIPQAWAPGWRATANGEPIEVVRVDHALQGVWLDWGYWQVELRYEPDSTRIGLWIAAAASVMLLAMFFRKEPRP